MITVRRGEHAQLSSLRRSLEADPERLARGPSEVLYAIADKIIDDYLEVVAEFENDVDEVETSVFSRGGQHEVDRVYQLKRELIEFKRSVMPLGAPLLRLATRELPVVPPEAKAYFRELADHHTEAREAVASFDEVLNARSCRPAWPGPRWPTTRTCARSPPGWPSSPCRPWSPASTG